MKLGTLFRKVVRHTTRQERNTFKYELPAIRRFVRHQVAPHQPVPRKP